MNPREIGDFVDIVKEMQGKFKLIYDPRTQGIVFQEKTERSSKIRGMVPGDGYDYIVTFSCGDIIGSAFGIGFDVRGKLYQASEEEFERVVSLARGGSHPGDVATERKWTREIRSDITFLRDAERVIYEKGFVLPESSLALSTY